MQWKKKKIWHDDLTKIGKIVVLQAKLHQMDFKSPLPNNLLTRREIISTMNFTLSKSTNLLWKLLIYKEAQLQSSRWTTSSTRIFNL